MQNAKQHNVILKTKYSKVNMLKNTQIYMKNNKTIELMMY